MTGTFLPLERLPVGYLPAGGTPRLIAVVLSNSADHYDAAVFSGEAPTKGSIWTINELGVVTPHEEACDVERWKP